MAGEKRDSEKLAPHFYLNDRKSLAVLWKKTDFSALRRMRALNLSIEKWAFIVDLLKNKRKAILFDGGKETCALCMKYIGDDCARCPVKERTHKSFCDGTPYTSEHGALTISRAKNELAFLNSLKQ